MKENLPPQETSLFSRIFKKNLLVARMIKNKALVRKPMPILLVMAAIFFIMNCSKTNTENIVDDLSFSDLSFDYKNSSKDLVLMGYKTSDTVVLTISKKRILQGIIDDKSYKYIFDDNTIFDFFIDSIEPYYENTNYIYLYVKGLAYTPTGNEAIEFSVYYKLEPDDSGNIFNIYTNADICKSNGCNSCKAMREQGEVIGCECRNSSGTCEHSLVTLDKGEYFILPIKIK
jgi:hypothetical protein